MKIVMFAGNGISSNIMYHALSSEFDILQVIVENKPSSYQVLKKRIFKLGFFKVLGQITFLLFNKLILSKRSANRIAEITDHDKLNIDQIPVNKIINVNSINDNKTKSILKELSPDIVIVNGTRIISKEILQTTDSIFINTHMGITPKYRGVHGGFWAIANDDIENCGVTVHLVDEGIDTGGILYQGIVEVSNKDNYNTIPYLQISKAIPLMVKAINDISNKRHNIVTRDDLESQLWSHPTIVDYYKYYTKFASITK